MSSLVIGVIGLALCAVGWVLNPAQFFRSYLVAYVFWTGIALGSLAILMMQYLTGGAWGIISRRPLESAISTLPLLALLFVPVLFGMHSLYSWTHLDAVAADPLLQHKSIYLNTTFFVVRWAICFMVWTGMAYLLNRWSEAQDRTADPRMALRLQSLSGPGLFVLAITMTVALIDWIMSLEPDWYSAIYGVTFIAGETLAAFAFITSIVVLLSSYTSSLSTKSSGRRTLPRSRQSAAHLSVMLWAYCSFAQLLIIWSGNLREEIPWYLHRLQNGWGWIAGLLILLHFFVPFFLLLSAELKRRPPRARELLLSSVILSMRFVDIFLVDRACLFQRVSVFTFGRCASAPGLDYCCLTWPWRVLVVDVYPPSACRFPAPTP